LTPTDYFYAGCCHVCDKVCPLLLVIIQVMVVGATDFAGLVQKYLAEYSHLSDKLDEFVSWPVRPEFPRFQWSWGLRQPDASRRVGRLAGKKNTSRIDASADNLFHHCSYN
jgi:hypothetical protein